MSDSKTTYIMPDSIGNDSSFLNNGMWNNPLN